MINVKTFLPVIVVVILMVNTFYQNAALKAVEMLHQNVHQISGISAATKFGVKTHLFLQCSPIFKCDKETSPCIDNWIFYKYSIFSLYLIDCESLYILSFLRSL